MISACVLRGISKIKTPKSTIWASFCDWGFNCRFCMYKIRGLVYFLSVFMYSNYKLMYFLAEFCTQILRAVQKMRYVQILNQIVLPHNYDVLFTRWTVRCSLNHVQMTVGDVQ